LGATADGQALNTGTCTWTLTDSAGNQIAGGTGTLPFVAGSNGDYSGPIESTVTSLLTPLAVYYLTVTFNQGGYDDKRRIRCTAAYRQEA
jgi:hypothetical protein